MNKLTKEEAFEHTLAADGLTHRIEKLTELYESMCAFQATFLDVVDKDMRYPKGMVATVERCASDIMIELQLLKAETHKQVGDHLEALYRRN
jgi:hypothetical protein